MAERWVLTPAGGRPLVLAHQPVRGGCHVTGVQTPNPPRRVQWSNRSEGSLPSSKEYENREVTLTLQLAPPTDEFRFQTHDFGGPAPEAEGDGDVPGFTGNVRRVSSDGNPVGPMLADIESTIAECAAVGGTLRRTVASGLSITFDVQDAETSEGPTWDVAYYTGKLTSVTLRFPCSPFARGTETLLGQGTKASGQRFLTVGGLQVPGDVPALARIVLSGAAQGQGSVLYGIDQPDPATSAAGVELPATAAPAPPRVTTVPASAAMPDALSPNVRRAQATPSGAPPGLWEPIAYLQTTSGSPLPVSGSFRVLARLSSPAGGAVRLRWVAGSGATGMSANGISTIGATVGAVLVDLGTVTVPDGAALDGVLERLTPGSILNLDRLLLLPTEYSAVAAATLALGPLQITAADDFQRTGALGGSTAPAGGTWATAGANDFQTASGTAYRTGTAATADTLPVDAGPITVGVSVRAEQACNGGERGVVIGNAAGIDALISGTPSPPSGAWAVWTYVEWDTVSPAGGERIHTTYVAGGGRADMLHSRFYEDWSSGHTFSMSLSGTTVRVLMTWPAGSNDHTYQLPAPPSTGLRAGIFTRSVTKSTPGGSVPQRVDFSEFTLSSQPPPQDRALYPAPATTEITSDEARRTDPAGNDGPIATYLGERPFLPASGRSRRPVRVVTGISRRQFPAGDDTVGNDAFTTTVYATPRWLQIPADDAPVIDRTAVTDGGTPDGSYALADYDGGSPSSTYTLASIDGGAP